MSRKISKEECITEIQRLYNLHGKITKSILKKHGNISYEVIKRIFTTMEVALNECNVPLVDGQHKMIDKSLVVQDLINIHNKFGYISKPLYEKNGKYNQKVVKRIFGSFSNMYKELNLNYSPSGYIPTNEELITDLKVLYEEHSIVTSQIIKQYGKFSITTYIEHFGTINEAYKLAGLPIRKSGDSSMANYTIQKFAKFLNEEPIYEKTFDWLVNYKTNRKLPIDGYFPIANIAIEYNGPQHYMLDKMYMPTIKELEYRKWLDSLKYDLIKKHGINLIVIPYLDKVDDLYIITRISNKG